MTKTTERTYTLKEVAFVLDISVARAGYLVGREIPYLLGQNGTRLVRERDLEAFQDSAAAKTLLPKRRRSSGGRQAKAPHIVAKQSELVQKLLAEPPQTLEEVSPMSDAEWRSLLSKIPPAENPAGLGRPAAWPATVEPPPLLVMPPIVMEPPHWMEPPDVPDKKVEKIETQPGLARNLGDDPAVQRLMRYETVLPTPQGRGWVIQTRNPAVVAWLAEQGIHGMVTETARFEDVKGRHLVAGVCPGWIMERALTVTYIEAPGINFNQATLDELRAAHPRMVTLEWHRTPLPKI